MVWKTKNLNTNGIKTKDTKYFMYENQRHKILKVWKPKIQNTKGMKTKDEKYLWYEIHGQ